ncbi:MAG TPA: hypothetical protein DDW42_07975 [Desulfobacteraceae bacterium]|nr:hypothetical protein [Desulfobacteraceae bacterium]
MSELNDKNNLNVIRYLKKTAGEFPDRKAIITRQRKKVHSITFQSLWDQADAFSMALKENYIYPGDRIILMIPMSVELYITLLGVIKMGGVAVFVDPWVSHKQIASFCSFAEPRGYIGIGKSHLLRLLEKKLLSIPLTITTGLRLFRFPAKFSFNAMLNKKGAGDIFAAKMDDPALITFTSGSSGIPKGANRTHGFLSSQYLALNHEFLYDTKDIDMPMFPVFALNNIADGRTSVIPDMDFRSVSSINAEVIYDQIIKNQVTTSTASPPFFDRLAELVIKKCIGKFPIRRILTGGAPVSDVQLQKWRKAFPDTEIEIVYGSTEAEPVSHISLEKRFEITGQNNGENKGYCTGIPTSFLESKIIRIVKGPVEFKGSWNELELKPGEIGELVVSGNHVCKDYYNNPEAVRESKIIASNGIVWHRMGDTGFFDEHNNFWMAGRVHSTIIRNKEIFHAQLVEQAASELFDRMDQVAAVGIPDPETGERLILVIYTAQNYLKKDDIMQKIMGAGYEIDDVILTKKPLPVDPRHNSKIDYQELRSLILQRGVL